MSHQLCKNPWSLKLCVLWEAAMTLRQFEAGLKREDHQGVEQKNVYSPKSRGSCLSYITNNRDEIFF